MSDLDILDYDCMGRFLPKVNFNDCMKSIKGEPYISYNDEFIYPVNGSYEFIKSICEYVDSDKINLNEKVIGINLETKILKTNINTYHFNKLVSTIPFNNLLDISNYEYDKDKLSSNKVVVFNIGFDKRSETDDHWIYYAGSEVFYRVGFYDNILKSDKMSIYVEIGMESDDIVNEKELYERVIDDLVRVGIITNHRVVDYQMLILDPAYVHITKESTNIYNEWNSKYNSSGIFSIGRYGSWTYCSIEDNIIQAKKISQSL